ncbi:MAG: beta-N-acetylhexosaminidase, partial [Bacteroidales bacterium]|nr:beta-N-acetylhexosaminidase [Bacteroidales bacterium]
MQKLISILMFSLFFYSFTMGQDDSLLLIPYPRQIVYDEGTFTFTPSTSLGITDSENWNILFAADELFKEVKNRYKLPFNYGKSFKKSNILIGTFGVNKFFDRKVKDIPEKDLKKTGKEGYILSIQQEEIILVANTDTGVFYGIQTLKQLIRANSKGTSIPCLTINDWPAMRYRGWQDDISRGPIPTLEFLKKEIKILSEYKLNAFTLYTEHVFKLDKHPGITPPDGITKEEIIELVEYAKNYHIEIIGNFQSFGHFARILQIPEYTHLSETPHVITPAKEESYKFLEDVYSEIAPAYESKLFNINCDEVSGLGTGPAKEMFDTLGKEGLYAYHINRIYDLLKPYGKTMMMWGDIARDYPEIIPKLPKDLIVLPWGYHPGKSFEADIVPFVE